MILENIFFYEKYEASLKPLKFTKKE